MIDMLNMHNLSEQDIFKYNLEIIAFDISDDDEFFVNIENSSWWVLGIDEEKDILYVENDGDGIFHNISYADIEDLELNNYTLIGVVDEFIDGMISTRDNENPIQDVKDFIDAKCVYKVKYGGI